MGKSKSKRIDEAEAKGWVFQRAEGQDAIFTHPQRPTASLVVGPNGGVKYYHHPGEAPLDGTIPEVPKPEDQARQRSFTSWQVAPHIARVYGRFVYSTESARVLAYSRINNREHWLCRGKSGAYFRVTRAVSVQPLDLETAMDIFTQAQEKSGSLEATFGKNITEA